MNFVDKAIGGLGFLMVLLGCIELAADKGWLEQGAIYMAGFFLVTSFRVRKGILDIFNTRS